MFLSSSRLATLLVLAMATAIAACSAPPAEEPDSALPNTEDSQESQADSGPVFDLDDRPVEESERTYSSNFIADAAQEVAPAVVQIEPIAPGNSQNSNPGQFRQFFEDFGPNRQGPDRFSNPREDSLGGSGSGFIIDESGTIVTNAHVVGNADSVMAVLSDGREFTGSVVGRDTLTDLAVIQLDVEDDPLPAVEFGDSGLLRPGEWVIALGSPLGLSNSLTAGIVSALGRTSQEIRVGDRRIDFIQTDAAINPGNSGGPLIDIDGRVVGINTAIVRGAEGIGFAIPVNEAQIVIDQLVASGRVVRSFVGIRMNTLDTELLEEIASSPNAGNIAIDPDLDTGVVVIDVLERSPAATAGLQSGDVIVELDGEPVRTAAQVQNTISGRAVGEDVEFRINRNGQERTVTVTTEELQQQFG
ncbi:MAG: trypsin-like peptidase domain-containing protein [Cyanobacteria bacterium P01_A01_bin.3]